MSAPEPPHPVSVGALAARLLGEACRPAAADSLQLEVVRDLALDTARELEALAGLAAENDAPDVLAEAALHCADLANLAACNAAELPPAAARRAATAARLAAGAVRDLGSLVEARDPDAELTANVLRDLRSAAWRAEFAASLVERAPGEGFSG